jgi:multimeric flavodoxin WrbA
LKVVGIVGSPRKNGNTEYVTARTLETIAKEGIETELIRLAGKEIKPCTACMVCQKEERCSLDDDLMPVYFKMKEADGIILSTPVYSGSATALMRAFMERTGFIALWNGNCFNGKVGGPLVVARRAGEVITFSQMTLWFQLRGFFIPGSTYWNIAFGLERGDVQRDEEGIKACLTFGKNMAFLMKKLKS